jgi:diaminopimelate epimerase
MRIFNSDGSEPTMCGNGIRCLVSFARRLGWEEAACSVETGAGILACRIEGSLIGAQLGLPRFVLQEGFCSIEKIAYPIAVLDTGVPHGVIFVEDLEEIDLELEGRLIRTHPRFAPEGVNVNFAQILPDRAVAVRTYERGVEGETAACGTGAAAVGWMACLRLSMDQPIKIISREGKEILEVRCSTTSGVELWGDATHVFDGCIEIERYPE